jgi:5-methylcytosine-specific restriction protein A
MSFEKGMILTPGPELLNRGNPTVSVLSTLMKEHSGSVDEIISKPLNYFLSAPPEIQKREKKKAQQLKKSPWWKNQQAKGICHHCGERFHPSELTMDHLIPIARGGKSDKKNCVPSCKSCNSKKANRLTLHAEP